MTPPDDIHPETDTEVETEASAKPKARRLGSVGPESEVRGGPEAPEDSPADADDAPSQRDRR